MAAGGAAVGRWMARKLTAAKAAIQARHVGVHQPSVLLMDGEHLRHQVQSLKQAMPGAHWNHAFAIKANPTLRVLELLGECGMGMEAASHAELVQGLRSGVSPDKVVYDCPVKTPHDSWFAVQQGVNMNVDNFQELRRLVDALGDDGPAHRGDAYLGVRLNPQVGAGSIASHATATSTSKFGIGLDRRQELLDAFSSFPWLRMAHVHVGSQGVDMSLTVAGIRALLDFAAEVNERAGYQQIKRLDIGGGLTVNFASEEDVPGFEALGDLFRKELPELFTGDYDVITEFGRAICSKAGFALSRVEFAKVAGDRHIALQHIGADFAIRTIYHPETWPLRITALDGDGNPKDTSQLVEQDVAGPCCIQEGDWVMIHDVGGYMHASYSCYNARQCPPVWGYGDAWGLVADTDIEGEPLVMDEQEHLRMDVEQLGDYRPPDKDIPFVLLQPGQRVEDTLSFFSHHPRPVMP